MMDGEYIHLYISLCWSIIWCIIIFESQWFKNGGIIPNCILTFVLLICFCYFMNHGFVESHIHDSMSCLRCWLMVSYRMYVCKLVICWWYLVPLMRQGCISWYAHYKIIVYIMWYNLVATKWWIMLTIYWYPMYLYLQGVLKKMFSKLKFILNFIFNFLLLIASFNAGKIWIMVEPSGIQAEKLTFSTVRQNKLLKFKYWEWTFLTPCTF